MAETVADFLLKRLSAWGVRRIYGYPGDGINGIMGALERSKEIEFIQARHEELAQYHPLASRAPEGVRPLGVEVAGAATEPIQVPEAAARS